MYVLYHLPPPPASTHLCSHVGILLGVWTGQDMPRNNTETVEKKAPVLTKFPWCLGKSYLPQRPTSKAILSVMKRDECHQGQGHRLQSQGAWVPNLAPSLLLLSGDF